VAVWSKAWVCGRSISGIGDSKPAGNEGVLVHVVCCQAEVSE
jgi:hypothetical protein